jgi:hypothetical protein
MRAPRVIGFNMPVPQLLTKGMPDVPTIESQGAAVAAAVDAELKAKTDAIVQEASTKKKMLEENAKLRLAEKQLQVEGNLKVAQCNVDKEAQMQILSMQEQALTNKTLYEENAAVAFAEQQKVKAMAEMAAASQKIAKEFADAEMKLSAQYQAVRGAGLKAGVVTPGMPTVPTPGVPGTAMVMPYGAVPQTTVVAPPGRLQLTV